MDPYVYSFFDAVAEGGDEVGSTAVTRGGVQVRWGPTTPAVVTGTTATNVQCAQVFALLGVFLGSGGLGASAAGATSIGGRPPETAEPGATVVPAATMVAQVFVKGPPSGHRGSSLFL